MGSVTSFGRSSVLLDDGRVARVSITTGTRRTRIPVLLSFSLGCLLEGPIEVFAAPVQEIFAYCLPVNEEYFQSLDVYRRGAAADNKVIREVKGPVWGGHLNVPKPV